LFLSLIVPMILIGLLSPRPSVCYSRRPLPGFAPGHQLV